MISALSRRLRLSGSSTVLLSVLISMLVIACSGPRQTVKTPPSQDVPPVVKHDEPVVPDVTQPDILEPRDAVKVDTVQWTEDNKPPLVTDKNEAPSNPPKKSHFNIALFMPFSAATVPLFSESQDPKLNRFVQYYAGVELAMREMDSLHLPVTIRSYDAESESDAIARLTALPEVKSADVIVGPYDKKDVESVAAFGLSHDIMVVSPWVPAFTTETANPNLIQLSPTLGSHAAAIAQYIRDEMPGKKIYIVSRDIPAERNRMQFFTKDQIIQAEELLIKDASPDLSNTDLHSKLSDDAGTIFILPYFAKTDETFINAFMRKLHADKDTREAIVFGMPQWIGFTNLTSNYMESLSLHLSISAFTDISQPAYQAFRNRFFQTFHMVPDLNAFLGYDLMKWLAPALAREGHEGLVSHPDPNSFGLASGFDIRPVYKPTSNDNAGHPATPLYFENKRIRILKYEGQDFILVR